MTAFDTVKKAKHYNLHVSGVECITLVEQLPFCLGNAAKYVWRADLKGATSLDLEKACYYVDRELSRVPWPTKSFWQTILAWAVLTYPRVGSALRWLGLRPWSYVDDVLLAHVPERKKDEARVSLYALVNRVLVEEEKRAGELSPLGRVTNALAFLLHAGKEATWLGEQQMLIELWRSLTRARDRARKEESEGAIADEKARGFQESLRAFVNSNSVDP